MENKQYAAAQGLYKQADIEIKKLPDPGVNYKHLKDKADFGYNDCCKLNQIDVPIAEVDNISDDDFIKQTIDEIIVAERQANLHKLVEMLDKKFPIKCRKRSVKALSWLIADPTHYSKIAENRVIKILINILDEDIPNKHNECNKAKMYVALVLANLAQNIDSQKSIADAGAIPKLLKLLNKWLSDKLEANVLLALSNLALCNPKNQLQIASRKDIFPLLTNILNNSLSDECIKNVLMLLSNLADKAENQVNMIKVGFISRLVTMYSKNLFNNHKLIMLIALSKLANNSVEAQQLFLEAGVIPLVVNMLRKDSPDDCKFFAAKIIELIIGDGDSEYKDNLINTFIEEGVIALLIDMLEKTLPDNCREWGASALGRLAVNEDIGTKIANAGAIPILIEMLKDNTLSCKCRVSATFVLGNLAAGNNKNKKIIADAGIIPILLALENMDELDVMAKALVKNTLGHIT